MQISSIKRKLILISLLTTGVVLFLSTAALIVNEFVSYRQSLVNELTVQAKIIGANSTAALSFNDRKSAEETLRALRASPGITYSAIYSVDNNLFAESKRNDENVEFSIPGPEGDGFNIGIKYIDVCHSIILDEENIGTIYIRSSLKGMYLSLIWYAGTVGVVSILSFGIAFLMILRLQQTITKPIFLLRQVTNKIAGGDLAARAELSSNDEFGSLARSFNVMAENLYRSNLKLIDEITERKKTEEEIKSIFDLSIDMICIADIKTNYFRKINPAFTKTLGYSEEEFFAKQFIDFIHPDDKVSTLEILKKMLLQGIPIINFQNRYRCKDGSYKWLMWTSKPIPEQGITYTVARDVTNEKVAKDELWKHRNQLEELVEERTTELIEINKHLKHEISERKIAEEQVNTSLREKEILLQEIHHRVKNNLQVVISLLNLQSKDIKDERIIKMFRDSQDRINSMALVHEKIYFSKDLANIKLREYINDLSRSLFRSYNLCTGRVEFNSQIEDISIGIDTSIPCGLIINELLSNSLKHAFPQERKGQIQLKIHTIKDGEIEIIFSDDGIGIPKTFDFRKSSSFGFRLVVDLVEYKLMGIIKLIQNGATEFQIRFKEIKYKKRL